jgi:lipoprotein-anchoring transpeptidase ErfK/SrfK
MGRRFTNAPNAGWNLTMRRSAQFVFLVAAFAILLAATGPSLAQYNSSNDPEGIRSGGAPGGHYYGWTKVSRRTVSFSGNYKPGEIVVNTTERRLYFVLEGGQAVRYGIGVGRTGYTWAGVKTVTAKREWPDWTPPEQMLKRLPGLSRYMKGGEDNPLGARAMYLGSTLYRIHGSNDPESIDEAVSSGCFRLTNDDVKDLYDRVKVGAMVHILR